MLSRLPFSLRFGWFPFDIKLPQTTSIQFKEKNERFLFFKNVAIYVLIITNLKEENNSRWNMSYRINWQSVLSRENKIWYCWWLARCGLIFILRTDSLSESRNGGIRSMCPVWILLSQIWSKMVLDRLCWSSGQMLHDSVSSPMGSP